MFKAATSALCWMTVQWEAYWGAALEEFLVAKFLCSRQALGGRFKWRADLT